MTRRWEAFASGALALVLLLAHLAFLRQDAAPPVWDEALHLLLASRLDDLLREPSRRTLDALRAAWDFYPPLHHALVGALMAVLGPTALAARIVNLAWLAVLGWGTHRAASSLFGRAAGWVAAALVVSFPFVTQMARMSMTDLGLAALAAAAVGFLLASGLRTRAQAVAFGLILGAGLMTKWIYPAFVAGPVLVWAWTERRWARLALAAAVAAAVAAPWYAMNAATIVGRGRFLAGLGPAQGNPYGWNWANAVVYAGVVGDVFVTAPEKLVLIAASLAALACLALGRGPRRIALVTVALWVAIPYVAMTAISNKDPRFVLPLVAPVAALCAWGLRELPWRSLRWTALALVFGYTAGLFALAVAGETRAARLLSALSGAPRLQALVRHDLAHVQRPPDPGWPSAAIVSAIHARLTPVAPWASLAVVPDLATVNPNTLTWLARGQGFRLDAHHPRDPAQVDAHAWEYVLLKPEGDQGADHTTEASAGVTARVLAEGDAFEGVQDFAGPAGETLRLLRTRTSLPPADLRASEIDVASPASRWHLGDGWGMPEAAGRWAIDREAVVRVQLDPGRAHRLKVELSPFTRLPAPQVITVAYRGTTLATWRPADPGWRVFKADIPATLPTGGIDEIVLTFAQRARPSDLGLSADARTLAAYFRRIRIEPL
jgi:4-amino-4-deoxy-L-arabinose transferase-like glycosyltransferase